MLIGVFGLGLAVLCALFPWYIFHNQEKFGVREMRFSGSFTPGRTGTTEAALPMLPPIGADEVPVLELDLFATATIPDEAPSADEIASLHQPFPEMAPAFRVVHVANGRAMIEDDQGLWVVQRGSSLPDASLVAAIEQREGGWVVVTSREDVFALE